MAASGAGEHSGGLVTKTCEIALQIAPRYLGNISEGIQEHLRSMLMTCARSSRPARRSRGPQPVRPCTQVQPGARRRGAVLQGRAPAQLRGQGALREPRRARAGAPPQPAAAARWPRCPDGGSFAGVGVAAAFRPARWRRPQCAPRTLASHCPHFLTTAARWHAAGRVNFIGHDHIGLTVYDAFKVRPLTGRRRGARPPTR